MQTILWLGGTSLATIRTDSDFRGGDDSRPSSCFLVLISCLGSLWLVHLGTAIPHCCSCSEGGCRDLGDISPGTGQYTTQFGPSGACVDAPSLIGFRNISKHVGHHQKI